MAASAPAKDAKPSGPPSKLPPEEKFWKRYSPHGEAPLSVAGSFAVHALGVGGMILFAVYIASHLYTPTRSMPVEPVRLALEKPGGGGSPGGAGGNTGRGPEDVGESKEDLPPELRDEPKRPALNEVEKTKINEKFDAADARRINQSSSDSAKAFARLSDDIRRRLSDGVAAGEGKRGAGEGGGAGTGKGKGVGGGTGDAKATLTKREKRMLRWHMRFTAHTGPEYLAQLRGLGAILAFPVVDGPNPVFKVVEDLRPGAQLIDKDVREYQRIYWIDDKPRSVIDIMAALKIQLPQTPGRFVAFMPESLERKLFDMERRYVERVLRKAWNEGTEDLIDETTFRVVLGPGGRYQPELISVSMRQ
jgi:hypothetical protein